MAGRAEKQQVRFSVAISSRDWADAARTIGTLSHDVGDLAEHRELTGISGVRY
jgi:hypothetical protein